MQNNIYIFFIFNGQTQFDLCFIKIIRNILNLGYAGYASIKKAPNLGLNSCEG